MSTGRYLSGSAKRKKKSALSDEVKKMKGTMSKFLIPASASGTSDVENMTVNDSASAISDVENMMVNDSARISPPKTVDYEEVTLKEQNKVNFPSNDPALWAIENFEEIREHFCTNKPNQNIDLLNSSTRKIGEKERKLSENNFYRRKQNKEYVCRDWLIYSESKCALFCYVCKLFSTSDQALSNQGYTDWKNVSHRLSEHECSSIHRKAVCLFSSRVSALSRIDFTLIEEYEAECKYWQNVLRRVVAVIKFLCQRGLPMFGSDETLNSPHNGNFLSCLELMKCFDPFIADHLAKHGNPGKGKTNYLSSTIVNEIVDVMGDCVLQKILTEIERAKYYGIIVDSTPDLSHVDQLAVVIRYVDEHGQPVERFIKFEPLRSHSSSTLCETILNLFETLKIDIKNCRGQSYDNASNMAGKYSGLQARIKEINPLAEYVPCSAHSLNLVISVAVECCPQVVSFFGFLQNLYNFFSASTHRWEILTSSLSDVQGERGLTLKSLSGTRWSACAEATKALRKGYICITNALKKSAMIVKKKMPHVMRQELWPPRWNS